MSTIDELRTNVREALSHSFVVLLPTGRSYGSSAPSDSSTTEIMLRDTNVFVAVEKRSERWVVELKTVLFDDIARSSVNAIVGLFDDQPHYVLEVVLLPSGGCSITLTTSQQAWPLDEQLLEGQVRALVADAEALPSRRAVRDPFVTDPVGIPPIVVPTPYAGVVGPLPKPPPPVPMTWFQGSISVPLPVGWSAHEGITIRARDGQANAIFGSEVVDPRRDVERYAADAGHSLATTSGYEELGFGVVTLPGGVEGRWRQYTWLPPDGVRLVQLQTYAVPLAGRGYTTTATGTATGWEVHSEVLRFLAFNAVVRPGPAASSAASAEQRWFVGTVTGARPDGWTVREALKAYIPGAQPQVITSGDPIDPWLTVDDYAHRIEAEVLAQVRGYRMHGSGTTQIHGDVSARWRQYEWQRDDGVPIMVLELYAVPEPGFGYVSTATTVMADMDEHLEAMRAMVFGSVFRPAP